MATTTRWGIRYPTLADAADVPLWMERMAMDLDDVAKDDQGTLALRPESSVSTPGKKGRYYFVKGDGTAANNGILWRDNGTGWDAINVTTKTIRRPHDFSLDVNVQTGDQPPGFQVDTRGGLETHVLSKIRFYTEAGTASVRVLINGTPIDGGTYSGWNPGANTRFDVTSAKSSADPTDVPLADGDIVTFLVVVAAGCTGLGVALYEDVTY